MFFLVESDDGLERILSRALKLVQRRALAYASGAVWLY
jgi:hypothetical protein